MSSKRRFKYTTNYEINVFQISRRKLQRAFMIYKYTAFKIPFYVNYDKVANPFLLFKNNFHVIPE